LVDILHTRGAAAHVLPRTSRRPQGYISFVGRQKQRSPRAAMCSTPADPCPPLPAGGHFCSGSDGMAPPSATASCLNATFQFVPATHGGSAFFDHWHALPRCCSQSAHEQLGAAAGEQDTHGRTVARGLLRLHEGSPNLPRSSLTKPPSPARRSQQLSAQRAVSLVAEDLL
jgi:hypothetical protein